MMMKRKESQLKDARRFLNRIRYLRHINAGHEELVQAFRDINLMISMIPNETLRMVAAYRYLECLSWREVEAKVNYSKASLLRYNKIIVNCVACQLW